jgi:hypothetical protein
LPERCGKEWVTVGKSGAEESVDKPRKGEVPWTMHPDRQRVLLDANGWMIGTMDSIDLARKVVRAVNGIRDEDEV